MLRAMDIHTFKSMNMFRFGFNSIRLNWLYGPVYVTRYDVQTAIVDAYC